MTRKTESEIRLEICKTVENSPEFYKKLAGMLRLTEAGLLNYLVKLEIETLYGISMEEPAGILSV